MKRSDGFTERTLKLFEEREDYQEANPDKLLALKSEWIEKDRTVLNRAPNIDPDLVKRLKINLKTNLETFQRMLEERPYDPYVYAYGSLLLSALGNKSSSPITYQDRLHEYIEDLLLVAQGKQSIYTVASIPNEGSNIKSAKYYGIKINDIQEENSEVYLKHELVVGLFGINKLKSIIPNFVYVYGMFDCSEPYVQEKGESIAYCNSEDANVSRYLIVENKQDVPTLYDILKYGTFEPQDYIAIYAQIFLALAVAYEQIDFTHYDLHTRNILVKKLDNPIVLTYTIHIAGKIPTYTVRTKYVIYIIDYDTCHVKINGISHGVTDEFYWKFNIRNGPNFAYDIFKLVCFSLISLKDNLHTSNQSLNKWLQDILAMFTNEPFSIVSELRVPTYYSLQLEVPWTYQDFMARVFTFLDGKLLDGIVATQAIPKDIVDSKIDEVSTRFSLYENIDDKSEGFSYVDLLTDNRFKGSELETQLITLITSNGAKIVNGAINRLNYVYDRYTKLSKELADGNMSVELVAPNIELVRNYKRAVDIHLYIVKYLAELAGINLGNRLSKYR